MSWLRNLLGLTTPEEKELQAMRKETAQLKEESNHIIYNAKKKADTIISEAGINAKNIIDEATASIAERKQDLEHQVKSLKETLDVNKNGLKSLEDELRIKQGALIELDEKVLLQNVSLYEPMYDFVNSDRYKEELDKIRSNQKALIKNGTAISKTQTWVVNGSTAEGKKMVRDISKLLLRAFNGECEHLTAKVKYNNFDAYKKRIESAKEAIDKLGRCMSISINYEYFDLKIKELHLAFEYKQMKQKEKEEQRMLREQLREEARLKKEIEEARRKIKKEQTHYKNAISAMKEKIASAKTSDDKEVFVQKLSELEEQAEQVEKHIADIDYRESNQKAGYVYVISNIGSFGEGVYKIGMTRRLDPMDRVRELGDASVPFGFDIHAMIFSDNAPKLEAAIHKAFENRKVNMVNTRREFFRVSLDEIKDTINKNFDGSVDFIETADAEQFRESEKLRQQMNATTEKEDA